MKLVSLEQRTPEWHRWRRAGITATEGAILTGRSHFGKSVRSLWRIKKGLEEEPDISHVPAVRYGVLHEDDCRTEWEKRHGDIAIPLCAECDADPIFRASFDGIASDAVPVECKCPGQTVFDEAAEKGTESELYARYWPQVQHQLLVSGAGYGWLAVWREGAYLEFRIERDEAYIAELMRKGRAFWKEYMETQSEPPPDPDVDVFEPDSENAKDLWRHLADEYAAEQAEVDRLSAELKERRSRQQARQKAFRDMMGSFRQALWHGVRVTVSEKQGNVDVDRLAEGTGLTKAQIDKYRRAPSELVRVTLTSGTGESDAEVKAG